ncbi:MAG: TonB-dependent receptor, partial [Sulfurovum sp.]
MSRIKVFLLVLLIFQSILVAKVVPINEKWLELDQSNMINLIKVIKSKSSDINFYKKNLKRFSIENEKELGFGVKKVEAVQYGGYISNERSEFEDSNIAILNMKLNTLNYNTKFNLPKLGNLETIIGIQGMHQTNENYGEEYLIPNAITNDFGVFGTANYEWKMNVIQAGLRFDNRYISSCEYGIFGEEGYFDNLNKTFNSFNASLGYKSNLGDNLILRINLASGFRAPNLAELTSNGVHEGTNRYEIGNSNLKTEQNIQTDLNLEYNSKHFEFFINGFYNHVNNYIYTSPTGTQIEDNDVYNYIQNEAKLFGGEIGVHLHPHPLDWLHFESSFETVTGEKQNGDYLPLIPANNWNNTIRLEFDNNWLSDGFASFNISSTFNQNNVSGFETTSNGYTLMNIGFGGKLQI